MGSDINYNDLDNYILKKIPQHINIDGLKVGDGILVK